MAETEIRVLIRRALAGEQDAFEALYRAYYPQIYGTVARRVDRESIEDLVQTTFMRAFRALRSFRGDAAFSTWLTQIALNACRSHIRARQVRQNWLQGVEDLEAVPTIEREVPHSEDPERAMHQKQRKELVRKSIQALPPRYRKAMWLHYVMDWSYEEITHALQVPIGTVKTWLCRARRQLAGEFRRLGLQPL